MTPHALDGSNAPRDLGDGYTLTAPGVRGTTVAIPVHPGARARGFAEDAFDAEPDLGRITAPTLVIGGADDPFYSVDLFERTAAGIPDGRAVVVPGKSHMYVAASKETAALALGFLLAA